MQRHVAANSIRRAYTLIEVLVVVAIIGIVGAVIVPQMLNSGSLTAQGAARLVIADLLYAQNEAIAQQQPRRVVFDTQTNSYRITTAQGQTLQTTWKGGSHVVDWSKDQRFAGVRLHKADFADENFVEFDVLGSPSQGGTIEITAGHTRYVIQVAPLTGRVTITQGTGG